MRKIFLTTCCLSLFLRPEVSEAFGYTASIQYDELTDTDANKDILKNLKGLAIVAPSTQLTSGELDHVEGVWIDSSLDLPGNEGDLLSTMQKRIGHPLTQIDLQEIRNSIARYYQEHSTPVVTVVVPSQDISNGVLQIVIVEGRLGEIKTRGNRWTSDKRLTKGLDIKPNERINSYLMQRNLAWLNRNPFRTTDAVLAAGGEPGTTDIELVTKERFPFRLMRAQTIRAFLRQEEPVGMQDSMRAIYLDKITKLPTNLLEVQTSPLF